MNSDLRETLAIYKGNIASRIAARRKRKAAAQPSPKNKLTDFIEPNTSEKVASGIERPLLTVNSLSQLASPLPNLTPLQIRQTQAARTIQKFYRSRKAASRAAKSPVTESLSPSSSEPILLPSLDQPNGNQHDSRPPGPLASHTLPSSPTRTPEQTTLLESPPSSLPSRPSTARRPVNLSKYNEPWPKYIPNPNATYSTPRRSLLLPVATDFRSRELEDDLFHRFFQNTQPLINTMRNSEYMVQQIEPEKTSSWITGFGLLLRTPYQIDFAKTKLVKIYCALTKIVTERPSIKKTFLRSLKEYTPLLRERMPDSASQQLIDEAEAKIQEKLLR